MRIMNDSQATQHDRMRAEHPDDRHVWMRHREQKLYTGSAKRRRQKGNDGKEERSGGKREGEKSGE